MTGPSCSWRALALVLLAVLCLPDGGQAAQRISRPPPPLAFEANRGQTDPSVAYLARGTGYVLYLRRTEAVFSLKTGDGERLRVLRMHLVDAAPGSALRGSAPLPETRNYYIGNDPSRWHRGIPTYRQVREAGVYPGVDLRYHGRGGQLEYDFIVAPGADPAAVRLRFGGADALRIDGRGDLVLRVGGRRVVHHAPVAYQVIDGTRVPVAARYVRRGQVVAFALAGYDTRRPLVIDPALNYSSYLGGTGNDQARAVTVDRAGNIYITGGTQSTDFPGAVNQPSGNTDAFVTKMRSDGSILFSTYLGSNGGTEPAPGVEMGNAIALDGQGRIYVTGGTAGGSTVAKVFPTLNGYQSSCPTGSGDAFVSILDSSGSLVYSTCVGGGLYEAGMGLAVDAAGNAYVAGWTTSSSPTTINGPKAVPFPTTATAIVSDKTSTTSVRDGFVFKLDPSTPGKGGLLYSTYLGSSAGPTTVNSTQAYALALDDQGMVYITGDTMADTDFLPSGFSFPPNAYQPHNAGRQDAFLIKLDTTAVSAQNTLKYLSFFGGSNDDAAYGIAVLAPDNVYIAGGTASQNDFPTSASPYDATFGGTSDAFVARFNLVGSSQLVYSTLLGGRDNDVIYGIALDSTGRAYVTGATLSDDFPGGRAPPVTGLTNPYGGQGLRDGFVTSIDGTGATLNYSAYLGGAGDDTGLGIALDGANTAYVVGSTGSSDFPIHNAQQAQLAAASGRSDAFLAEVGLAANLGVVLQGIGTPQQLQPFSYKATITNSGPDTATGVVLKLQMKVKATGAPVAGLGTSPNDEFNNCTYDGPSATLTCPLGSIKGDPQTPPKTVTITGTFSAGQTMTVTATVSASESDPDPSNNTSQTDSTAGTASSTGSGSGSSGSVTTGGSAALGPFMIVSLFAVTLLGRGLRKRRGNGGDRGG